MFGTVANGTLPGRKYICSLLKSKVSILGFVEIFGLLLKVLHMKINCVSKFFTSSVFLSDKQCLKYPNF